MVIVDGLMAAFSGWLRALAQSVGSVWRLALSLKPCPQRSNWTELQFWTRVFQWKCSHWKSANWNNSVQFSSVRPLWTRLIKSAFVEMNNSRNDSTKTTVVCIIRPFIVTVLNVLAYGTPFYYLIENSLFNFMISWIQFQISRIQFVISRIVYIMKINVWYVHITNCLGRDSWYVLIGN